MTLDHAPLLSFFSIFFFVSASALWHIGPVSASCSIKLQRLATRRAARSQQSLSHSCRTDTPGSSTTETLRYVTPFFEEPDAAYGSHDSRAECGILADDAETRRSISGGLLTLYGVLLGSWARTQATTVLSSWEAELYAIGSGCAESLGFHMLLMETEVRIATRSWAYEACLVCV